MAMWQGLCTRAVPSKHKSQFFVAYYARFTRFMRGFVRILCKIRHGAAHEGSEAAEISDIVRNICLDGKALAVYKTS